MPSGYALDESTKRRIKEEAPSLVRDNPTTTKGAIARMLGIHRATLWQLEVEDDSFRELMAKARDARDARNVEYVENALLKKLRSGTASGSEYEFYLVNRASDRWKRRFVFNNEVNQYNLNNSPLSKMKDSELDDLISGRMPVPGSAAKR